MSFFGKIITKKVFWLITKTITDEFLLVTKILFEKNFLNMGLGSISLKLNNDQMLINKKNRHIEEEDFYKNVHILKKDLSWEEMSDDIKIHSKIYETISSTKAIANIFPLNTITFSIEHHNLLKPLDLIGTEQLKKIKIIHITNKTEWNENKEFIIAKHLKLNDILIIKGYGVFIKARDVREILKKAVILENSAAILLNSQQH